MKSVISFKWFCKQSYSFDDTYSVLLLNFFQLVKYILQNIILKTKTIYKTTRLIYALFLKKQNYNKYGCVNYYQLYCILLSSTVLAQYIGWGKTVALYICNSLKNVCLLSIITLKYFTWITISICVPYAQTCCSLCYVYISITYHFHIVLLTLHLCLWKLSQSCILLNSNCNVLIMSLKNKDQLYKSKYRPQKVAMSTVV